MIQVRAIAGDEHLSSKRPVTLEHALDAVMQLSRRVDFILKHQAAHLVLHHVSWLNLQHLCRQADPVGCAINVDDDGADAVALKQNILHT